MNSFFPVLFPMVICFPFQCLCLALNNSLGKFVHLYYYVCLMWPKETNPDSGVAYPNYREILGKIIAQFDLITKFWGLNLKLEEPQNPMYIINFVVVQYLVFHISCLLDLFSTA